MKIAFVGANIIDGTGTSIKKNRTLLIEENKIVEITDKVIVLENVRYGNLGCIEIDDGLVFVDAGARADIAAQFRAQMEKRFEKEATHLFLTHFHFDHLGGLSAFKDLDVIDLG